MPYKDLKLRREKGREYTKIYRLKNKKTPPDVECPVCLIIFQQVRSNKKYCSRKCKSSAWELTKLDTPYRGRDAVKARSRAVSYYHSDAEKSRKRLRESQKRNLGLYRAMAAKRRASKLQRTPPWADLKAIRDFYKNCPEGYHVDHIIPLQGKTVSGLHILSNLQYLLARDNISKSNRYDNP